ncbi:hypothetical protein HHL08_21980 [Sphingobium sp. AR-3-1]|uniref:O-antigen ligase domain-containing protein n=1 Tax=Sphingobium psychrophilum TaxID=2728834 RepID=A0A7X9WZL4_9SPHN|nr:hypothetical protein [Sphingobium psychrophilum]NML12769.1 hypothetical protein [Sphingobium psychrophilum]
MILGFKVLIRASSDSPQACWPVFLALLERAVMRTTARLRGNHFVRSAVPIKSNWGRIIFIALIFMLFSGVATLLAGLPSSTGKFTAAGITLVAPLLFLAFMPRTFQLSRLTDFFPIGLFAWFLLVSFISNRYVYGYGYENWVPAMYMVVPLLTYYLWWGIGATLEDIVLGIMLTGLIATGVIIIDQFLHLPQLDELRRMSAFTDMNESRRIIFLKNECVMALLLTIVSLSKGKSLLGNIWLFFALGVMGFTIVQVFESRMALAAVAIAVLFYVLFSRAGAVRRVVMVGGLIIIAVPASIYVFDRYLAPIFALGISDYIEDYNVEIRLQSAAYWMGHFERTMGLGIGVMSVSPNQPNIQSSVIDQAFLLADMGMFGALYQYGIIGLIATVIATIYLIRRLFILGLQSTHPRAPEMFMMACFILAFELQPVPISFFTLQWSLPLGATLWYAMRRGDWESRQLEEVTMAATRGQ